MLYVYSISVNIDWSFPPYFPLFISCKGFWEWLTVPSLFMLQSTPGDSNWIWGVVSITRRWMPWLTSRGFMSPLWGWGQKIPAFFIYVKDICIWLCRSMKLWLSSRSSDACRKLCIWMLMPKELNCNTRLLSLSCRSPLHALLGESSSGLLQTAFQQASC